MQTEHRPRRPTSLGVRVTILVGLVTTMMFLLVAWGVERSIEAHFAKLDLVTLEPAWGALQAVIDHEPAQSPSAQHLEQAIRGSHDVVFAVWKGHEQLVAGTAPPALIALWTHQGASSRFGLDTLRIWEVQGHSYRGAVVRSGGGTVAIATRIDIHMQYLRTLQDALWVGTFLASLISIAVAGLAVRAGHAPLRRISARFREITTERLQWRIDPEEVPPDLAELVKAFNAMLGGIDRGFGRLRDLSADMAHELRTPITNLRTQTQVALSKPRDATAYREVLYSNLEEFERLSAMIEDMLFLAQTDRGLGHRKLVEVDLAVETQALFDFFDAWVEDREVSLQLRANAPTVHGDRDMLRRALSNLVANAVHHTPPGRTITVQIERHGDWVTVEVCNPGAPIAPEHLPHLFERFYRTDASRQRRGEGAGLGLAIVQSIAQAHGGNVFAASHDGMNCFGLNLLATH